MEETEAFAQSIIRGVTGQESQGERPHQAGDYSFNNIGISSFFMLLSTMPDELRESKGYYGVGGCGANIEWHTEEDLIHIADREILLKDMRIYVAAALGAANATIAPFDFRATLRGFSATLDRYQEAAAGTFDFTPSHNAIAELDGALSQLSARAGVLAQAGVNDPRVKRVNGAVRGLARRLVPVNYTRGPAFFHDPAESIPPLPDLEAAFRIPATSPEELGFVKTHLMRGQNRLVAALRDARRLVQEAIA
jgi:hypothetical protein